MKKLISLLLSLAMVFSLAMPAMAAEGDTATVYFQNNWMWTEVCAYIHYTDGTENAASPGLAMEIDHNDSNYDIYSVTFPVSNIDYIVFSGIKDDGSGGRDYSPQIPASDLYRNATYYMLWNDGNAIGKDGGEGESLDSAAPSTPSGPTVNGNTTGDVSATFDPDIAITGITYSGETVRGNQESGYEYLIPTDFSGEADDYIPVIITISGTNLEYAAYEEEVLLKASFSVDGETQSVEAKLSEAVAEGFTYQDGSLVLDPQYSLMDGLTVAYSFSNDNGSTWSAPVTLVFKQGYSITVNTAENGIVTADKATAVAGETVELFVEAAEGYELDTLTVMQGETPVEVSADHTFTMPAGDVAVTASFKAAEKAYNITISAGENGNVVAKEGDEVVTSAHHNDDVTLVVTPDSGYELDTLTISYVDADGENQTLSYTDSYTFVMPAADVTVTATFKSITYAVNIDANVANGTVAATPNPAKEGDTVTVTVEAVAGYAYVVNSLKVVNDTTDEEVEVDEAAKTFVMPAADVTVYAEFEKLSVTSANIVWGSMAFTYSDEQVEQADGSTADKGWSNDGTEGAGTVTVTNTGSTTFLASAAYTPADDYTEITGTLTDALTLNAAESGTFTLTLSGQPKKALSGEKIGTVTVTIEEYTPVVTTSAELTAAVAIGGVVKLGNSISMTSHLSIPAGSNVTLDLNGYTLSAPNGTNYRTIDVADGATLTVKDTSDGETGLIKNTVSGNNGIVVSGGTCVLESGTVTTIMPASDAIGGQITINGGKVSEWLYSSDVLQINGGTIAKAEFSGANGKTAVMTNGTITGELRSYNNGVVKVTGGSVTGALYEVGSGTSPVNQIPGEILIEGGTFASDPTEFLADGYTATDNGDGTWTVTAN